jgi:hypothetical protein
MEDANFPALTYTHTHTHTHTHTQSSPTTKERRNNIYAFQDGSKNSETNDKRSIRKRDQTKQRQSICIQEVQLNFRQFCDRRGLLRRAPTCWRGVGFLWPGSLFSSDLPLLQWHLRRRFRRREEILMMARKFFRYSFLVSGRPVVSNEVDLRARSAWIDTFFFTQAVLVADSFKRRMSPITYSTPKCLLPVVNIPLRNYALEAIISAGLFPRFLCTDWIPAN